MCAVSGLTEAGYRKRASSQAKERRSADGRRAVVGPQQHRGAGGGAVDLACAGDGRVAVEGDREEDISLGGDRTEDIEGLLAGAGAGTPVVAVAVAGDLEDAGLGGAQELGISQRPAGS